MSIKDLQNYLTKYPVNVPESNHTRRLLIVSDSKGGYLQRLPLESDIESTIIYFSRAGRTSKQAADLIAYNIEHYLHTYGNILIAVWTGTCDFTVKPDRFIRLGNTTVDDIVGQFKRILDLCKPYGNRVKVVFLECPYFSLKIFNSHRGHKHSDSFVESDRQLKLKIDSLNAHIRQLNESNSICAPKFSVDLTKRRKYNKSYKVDTISYSLLKDGIHSGFVLSRYWLRRIINTILAKFCFS